jgi:hypothetical protein
MSVRKFLLWGMFIGFSLFSTWVLWEVGYFGIWQAGFTSAGGLQILLDLVICCFLIASWMKKDAESRGLNPYPWIIGTLFMGSISPLVYLLVREYSAKKPQHVSSQAA